MRLACICLCGAHCRQRVHYPAPQDFRLSPRLYKKHAPPVFPAPPLSPAAHHLINPPVKPPPLPPLPQNPRAIAPIKIRHRHTQKHPAEFPPPGASTTKTTEFCRNYNADASTRTPTPIVELREIFFRYVPLSVCGFAFKIVSINILALS